MRHPLYPHFLSIVAVLVLAQITPVQAAQTSAPSQPETAWSGPHYLTVPAAAFHPAADDYNYAIHGRYLIHYGRGSQPDPGNYLAAVQLPQGARIKKITYFWKDPGAPGTTSASLSRALRNTDTVQEVAGIVGSFDTFPPSFGYTDNTANHFAVDEPINNLLYSYYLRIDISGGGQVWGCAVQIEYDTDPAAADPGLLVVPPAAFTPFSDHHHFYNFGWAFENFDGPASLADRGKYVAQVNLPDGATVTGLTFQWKRNLTTTQQATALLQRSLLSNGNYENLATVSAGPGSGSLISSTTTHTISYAQVSNFFYTYWLTLDLPDSNPIEIEARDVEIQYTLPTASLNMISVSTAALQPYEDGYTHQTSGRLLNHYYGPGGSTTNGWYLAPLDLPDGVQVSYMSFYWFENTTLPGVARFQRTALNQGNYQDLAVATTTAGSNSGSVSFDDTVDGGPVDNRRYAYWLVVDIPSNAFLTNVVTAYSVKLFYNHTLYLPLERR